MRYRPIPVYKKCGDGVPLEQPKKQTITLKGQWLKELGRVIFEFNSYLIDNVIQYSTIEVQKIKEVLDMATTLVQVRIDDELKNQATAVYDALGIDLSTAVRMFLKRSVMVNGVPFNMTLPKNDYKAERAARALQELSNAAVENGTSEMSLEEINAEIEAVRKAK